MDFILIEAEVESKDYKLNFSDDEMEETPPPKKIVTLLLIV